MVETRVPNKPKAEKAFGLFIFKNNLWTLQKSELWRKCRKRRFLRYYYEIVSYFTTFEENELSKIRKSREFSSPNVFSSREGILQDSHVQRRPSSKPQHQILLWRSTTQTYNLFVTSKKRNHEFTNSRI